MWWRVWARVGVWYLLADDASTVQVRQSPRAVVQANEVEELGDWRLEGPVVLGVTLDPSFPRNL